MIPEASIPDSLKMRYDGLVEERPNIAQLELPLSTFFPTFDAYLTNICQENGTDPVEIDMERFSSKGLCRMLQWMQEYGFLGRSGHTVNVFNYLLEFPTTGICLLWIPKNSCTSIKNILAGFEPEQQRSQIRRHRFHETIQATFGLDIKRFFNDDFAPLTILVRHPAERLVSCYIDKFLNPVLSGRNLEPFVVPHIIGAQMHCGVELDMDRSVRFSEFIDYVIASPPWRLDAHWRPQTDFVGDLDQKRSTTFIRSDNLDFFAKHLGLNFEAKRHNRSGGKRFFPDVEVSGEFADVLPADMNLDRIDAYNQFFSAEMFEKLRAFFAEDIRLFERAI